MSKKEIDKLFSPLAKSGYEITSPANPDYNCIAWAAEDDEVWWWPDIQYTAYWPPQAPRIETIEAFIKAYEILDYILCDTSEYEEGFEKIAIYEKDGKPTHAARQLNSGNWTSKLGRLEDIEHATLDDLTGQHYGSITIIMKRPKRKSS